MSSVVSKQARVDIVRESHELEDGTFEELKWDDAQAWEKLDKLVVWGEHEVFTGKDEDFVSEYVVWVDPEGIDYGWLWNADRFKDENGETDIQLLIKHFTANFKDTIDTYKSLVNGKAYIVKDREDQMTAVLFIHGAGELKDGFEVSNYIYFLVPTVEIGLKTRDEE